MTHRHHFDLDNVLLITFGDDPEDDTNAYRALTDLKQLDSDGQIKLIHGVVVKRYADENLNIESEVGEQSHKGTTGGGVVGVLVGIVGGPFGVLLGGATGAVVGALADMNADERTQSVLLQISERVEPFRTAVLAQVAEQTPEIADAAMARLGGEVMRASVADVEDEIAELKSKSSPAA
jgi:uncharacterized membrane protein